MNPQTDTAAHTAFDGQTHAAPLSPGPLSPVPLSPTRPMYWSIRRELWENRSIVFAPLIATALVMFGLFVSTMTLPHRLRAIPAADALRQRAAVAKPFDFAPVPVILTALLVGVFYCLDALHGERRDRSILFWKSLPVSDRTTLLSKASIPLVVLPVYCFVIVVITQVLMMALATFVLSASGTNPAILWTAFADADPALRTHRAHPLARTDLRVAAAGIRLGTPGAVPLGRPALRRRGVLRRRHVPDVVLRQVHRLPDGRVLP